MSLRPLAVLLLAAACSDKPAPPDLAKFKAMSEDDQCEAAAPRATRCMDDLLVADIKAVGLDKDLKGELVKEVRTTPSTPDERKTMHKVQCMSDPAYANAVVACWTIEPCKEFVECVVREESKAPPRKHEPPPPPIDLDNPSPD